VVKVNFLKNEFLVATTRNQLHRSGATLRCSSHSRMYYDGRNRMLNVVNPLKPRVRLAPPCNCNRVQQRSLMTRIRNYIFRE